jgi:alpha-ribazole phosphatase/probable phosphoglycerate mutase
MDAVAEDLAQVDLAAVYSSDLKRARYGGEVLIKNRDIELRIDPVFRELDFGIWEGMTGDEVRKRYPGELERRYRNFGGHRIPEGETIPEFLARVKGGLDGILTEHKGKNVALVAHSGVNRAILLLALGGEAELIWRFYQSFGCLNIVDYFGDGLAMIRRSNGANRFESDEP